MRNYAQKLVKLDWWTEDQFLYEILFGVSFEDIILIDFEDIALFALATDSILSKNDDELLKAHKRSMLEFIEDDDEAHDNLDKFFESLRDYEW
jgi:hypothetical protein